MRIKLAELIEPIHGQYLEEPDTGEVVPSHFLGEAGILLVHWRLTRSAEAADRLYAAIERNIPNPVNEALWAAPGTMAGALHMLECTGERRWEALFLENVAQLWRAWLPSENAACRLWTQHLYGETVQLIGARVCDACDRPGAAHARALRPRALLVMDRGPGPRRLPATLHRRLRRRPLPRRLLNVAVDPDHGAGRG